MLFKLHLRFQGDLQPLPNFGGGLRAILQIAQISSPELFVFRHQFLPHVRQLALQRPDRGGQARRPVVGGDQDHVCSASCYLSLPRTREAAPCPFQRDQLSWRKVKRWWARRAVGVAFTVGCALMRTAPKPRQRRAAAKTTRAAGIGRSVRVYFMAAVSGKPQTALCVGQKAAAWGRVVFGAAALRAFVPRPHSRSPPHPWTAFATSLPTPRGWNGQQEAGSRAITISTAPTSVLSRTQRASSVGCASTAHQRANPRRFVQLVHPQTKTPRVLCKTRGG